MNVDLKRKCESVDVETIQALAQKLNLSEKLVELLYSRGFSDEKKIEDYLAPNRENFYDPFLMKGMREAVDRLELAVQNKERVVVYGDYDADGICAAAILSLYLSSRGVEVHAHIPNRIGEGYGLNVESLETIIENVIPDLILTCDCGISGYNEVEFVLDLGVDIIVTDHHEIGEKIPNCIVVNPKQSDCSYPYDMLCGAGVAFKLVQAMGGLSVAEEYLDLATVATIADLVPLLDENRLIVQFGLEHLKRGKNIGLRELFSNLGVTSITSSEIAYKIAPRINAAGRIGDAYRAFTLVTSDNLAEVRSVIDQINEDNGKRKALCDEMYDEAIVDLALEDLVNERAIMLSHPAWEKGITGIVAARLTNDYNRPTFIMVKSGDGVYKGTCRSVEGINIHDLLSACSDCLIEFGGHSQAAGFSIEKDSIPQFKRRANEYLKRFDNELFMPVVKYDLELDDSEIDYKLMMEFERMEPVGNSNTKPLICLKAHRLTVTPSKSNPNHISIVTPSGLQIFAYNFAKQSYQLLGDEEKDLVIELQQGYYGRTAKGVLRACKPYDLYVNNAYVDSYCFENLIDRGESTKYREIECGQLEREVNDGLYGTLIVADSKKAFDSFCDRFRFHFCEYMYPSNKNNYSRIMIAPDFDEMRTLLPLYNKIVFLYKPLSQGVISRLNGMTKAEIVVVNTPRKINALSFSRETFGRYYEELKQQNGVEFINFFALYKRIRSTMLDINVSQLAVCVAVFAQLGLVEVTRSPFCIRVISGKRADLESSAIFRSLKQA